MDSKEFNLTSQTADIVSAYVAHNAMSSDKLPDFIGSVYNALSRASVHDVEPPKAELKPAVAVKKSVTPEYIICLEDGKKVQISQASSAHAVRHIPRRIPGEVGAAA
jgi:predicted transcriptional regulator